MIKDSILAFTGLLFTASAANAACPKDTTQLPDMNGKEVCQMSGNYNFDLTLTADKLWVLSGGVFIGGDNRDSATLRIQADTKIVGQAGKDFLVIHRGSKIMAEGTKLKPIVFTSAKPDGQKRRGDWGGLIINGNAPVNGCGNSVPVCELEGEGSTGKYGGNNPDDNSGVLRYVRVEYAGNEISPNNELNGIAFQGVGRDTEVNYIQVHMNADDGVEFFGGTVNVKHVVLTGNRDDSLDWVHGWQGKGQFILVQQYDDQGNNGIEADNYDEGANQNPRSMPELSNMTLLGTSSAAAKGGEGVLLRYGTGAIIHNSIIKGFKNSCLDIDHPETFQNAERNQGIQFTNNIVHCTTNYSVEAGDSFNVGTFFESQAGNSAGDPMLNGYKPAALSPALDRGDITPDDFFFDPVDFVGAVDNQVDWTEGWVTPNSL